MARQLVQGTADNGIALVRPLGHSAGVLGWHLQDLNQTCSALQGAAMCDRGS
jgi:hypothetical protein